MGRSSPGARPAIFAPRVRGLNVLSTSRLSPSMKPSMNARRATTAARPRVEPRVHGSRGPRGGPCEPHRVRTSLRREGRRGEKTIIDAIIRAMRCGGWRTGARARGGARGGKDAPVATAWESMVGTGATRS